MAEEALWVDGKSSFPDRAPCPTGMFVGVCCDVVDLGMQMGRKGPLRKVRLFFQVDKVNPESGKRYEVMETFAFSLTPGSALSDFLEGWRGAPFTDAEREPPGFNVMALLGACGIGTVTHSLPMANGRIYANITMSRIPKEGPFANVNRIEPLDFTRQKDRPKQQQQAPAPQADPFGPPPTAKPAAAKLDTFKQQLEETDDDLPF